jgi:hypothetical protein
MTPAEEAQVEDGASRRFKVELLIVHPTMDPAEIAAALGLEGHFTQRVGDQRKTPKGTLLPGKYRDTRWRHCVRHAIKDQWFAEAVTQFVDRLAPHRAFLRDLRSTGGKAHVNLEFLGDGYFSDAIPRDVLSKLVDLELDLGLASYEVPQT